MRKIMICILWNNSKRKNNYLQPIEITRSDYFCYKYFYYCIKTPSQKDLDSISKKKQIVKLSENGMFRRMDLVNLMKHLDQISLLEKIILNKNQVFMLRNKAKQISI